MTTAAPGAHFEITVDGVVRTHCQFHETAIWVANLLQQEKPNAKIVITDLRDGSVVPHDRSA